MLSGREAIRAGTHYSQGGDCQQPNKGHHRAKKLFLPPIIKSIAVVVPADPGSRFITDVAGWEIGVICVICGQNHQRIVVAPKRRIR
jgi:hypothetical protein